MLTSAWWSQASYQDTDKQREGLRREFVEELWLSPNRIRVMTYSSWKMRMKNDETCSFWFTWFTLNMYKRQHIKIYQVIYWAIQKIRLKYRQTSANIDQSTNDATGIQSWRFSAFGFLSAGWSWSPPMRPWESCPRRSPRTSRNEKSRTRSDVDSPSFIQVKHLFDHFSEFQYCTVLIACSILYSCTRFFWWYFSRNYKSRGRDVACFVAQLACPVKL